MGRCLLAVSAATACLAACRNSDQQETVHALYPVGTPKAELAARCGEPTRILSLEGSVPDAYAAAAARDVERVTGVAPRLCHLYHVLRPGAGSSLGAFGMWGDYVFFDADGRVLGARRRFLD